MRVAIDARMIKSSGIGVYMENLIKNNDYTIALGNPDDLKKYQFEAIIPFTTKIYRMKEQLKFPYRKLKKLKPDILHVPHYNVPIFYRGKMVVTIHDVTHLIFPEFLPNKFAKIYAKIMIWIATKKASQILTVSENTKKDLIKMFKVKPDKITVIYNGVGGEFVKKEKKEYSYLYDKYKIDKNKKNIMYVGNLKPHKNLERLLIAFSKLENKDNYNLILVGKAFGNYNVLNEKEESLGIKDSVIKTGLVEQEELVDLYNLADLFVLPSLYEGFGIPVIEALACMTPVICSNNSSLPEVGQDKVGYFDAFNPDEIRDKIDEYINKIYTKEELEELREYALSFDWKDISEKTWDVMKNVNDKL